jgi:ACR3 family arsenite efflux pump ArsB
VLYLGLPLAAGVLTRQLVTRRGGEQAMEKVKPANSTGRDFEIAIAIAITAFSPTVALATVVGPLIEVPVMLTLVWSAMRLEKRLFGTETAKAAAVLVEAS